MSHSVFYFLSQSFSFHAGSFLPMNFVEASLWFLPFSISRGLIVHAALEAESNRHLCPETMES